MLPILKWCYSFKGKVMVIKKNEYKMKYTVSKAFSKVLQYQRFITE